MNNKMEKNKANELKWSTLNYNGVLSAKDKFIKAATKTALEGKSSATSHFSKPEFTTKKMEQLVKSLEEDGFQVDKVNEEDNSFEIVISWA